MAYIKTLNPEEVVRAVIEILGRELPDSIRPSDTITGTMLEDGSVEVYIIPAKELH